MRHSLLFLVLGTCFSCQSPKDPLRKLSSTIDSVFATAPDFNGVALIAENGKPVYHKAFGFTNLDNRSPLDTTSLFELASVSKQFTALCILMLYQEGKVNFDDPVEKFVPGLPYPNITIRNLLNHTSGLPDYQAIMDEHWDKSKAAGNDDIIEYLKRYHPAKHFEPQDKYEYSNTGYVLLGSIVEKASGQDFVAFCRERIFIPVGMSSTNLLSNQEKAGLKNFARGYIYVPEKHRYIRADSFPSSNYIQWLGNRKGPGRITSTTADLLKWDRALYTEQLLPKESLTQAFQPATLSNDSLSNYGFGWMLRSHPTLGKIVWHSGGNPGYKTVIVRYIDQNKTVIILCNNAHEKFEALQAGIELVLATSK